MKNCVLDFWTYFPFDPLQSHLNFVCVFLFVFFLAVAIDLVVSMNVARSNSNSINCFIYIKQQINSRHHNHHQQHIHREIGMMPSFPP